MRLDTRHSRFLAAFSFGIAFGLAGWVQDYAPVLCALAGVNAFFLAFLGLMGAFVRWNGPEDLRRHASAADEGVALILALALLAIATSITTIILVLNWPAASGFARIAALSSLPLGWATVHVLAAFHYAHLHYRGGGLVFPGKGAPGPWDFLYVGFTIGMTAQVSDVVAETRTMRQAILVHGVTSFFYNTGILALAINAAVTSGLGR